MHERYLHSGRHHILSLTREHYWVSKRCSLARKIVSSCFNYKRRVLKLVPTLMTDLLTERLSIKQQPFTYTGVDLSSDLLKIFEKN